MSLHVICASNMQNVVKINSNNVFLFVSWKCNFTKAIKLSNRLIIFKLNIDSCFCVSLYSYERAFSKSTAFSSGILNNFVKVHQTKCSTFIFLNGTLCFRIVYVLQFSHNNRLVYKSLLMYSQYPWTLCQLQFTFFLFFIKVIQRWKKCFSKHLNTVELLKNNINKFDELTSL